MSRWVLHVDLDQFIAAVEVLRHPELAGLPVVVGGDGDPTKRGVVSTASYEARELGVHSGVPLRTAVRRAPDAVFLPVDKEAYESASAQVMAALRGVPDAVVEVMGWDEAFVGIEQDDPEGVAREIQGRVLDATGLHCSVGIGRNKLQAKLATGFGKPAGVFRLTGDNWFEVLGDRSTDALWGIGTKTARKLAVAGIHTVRQLAATEPETLAGIFGPTIGPWLVRIGQGRASARVDGTPYVPRSRSHEHTFQRNVDDWDDVRAATRRLTREVLDDPETGGRPVLRVAVKIRFAPFFTYTRSAKLPEPTNDREVVEAAVLAVLERFTDRRPVRLVGVRTEFADNPL